MDRRERSSVGIVTIMLLGLYLLAPAPACATAVGTDNAFHELLRALPQDKAAAPDPTASLLSIADTRFRQGLWQEASASIAQLLARDPHNLAGHGMLGTIWALTGSRAEAEKELAIIEKSETKGFYAELIRSVIAAQERRYDLAENHLNTALKKDPTHPIAIYYLGSLNLAQNRLEDAKTLFLSVLAESPEFAPALAALGQTYRLQNQMALAAESLQKAVAAQPEIMLYRQQLIDLYNVTGQTDAAERETRAGLYYAPGVKERFLEQGMQLLAMGSYDRAIELMEKLIAHHQRAPEAFYIKAAALANLGKVEAASENAQAYIAQAADVPQAHHYTGMLYLALNDIDRARLHLRTVIGLNPTMGKSFVPLTIIEQIRGNPDWALNGLNLARNQGEPPELVDYLSAHVLLSKGDQSGYLERIRMASALMPGVNTEVLATPPVERETASVAVDRNLMVLFFFNSWYDKTAELAERLLRIDPKDIFALYYRALAKTAQGKTAEAIDAHKKLISRDPGLYGAHLRLGELYVQSGDFQQAEEAFDEAIKIKPEAVDAHLAKGDLLVLRGDEMSAISIYERMIQDDPKMGRAYQRLSMIYAEQPKKRDEALALALKAEELAPEDPVSGGVVGWAYVQQGNLKQGIEKLKTASFKMPNDPMVHYHLGVAYYKNNEMELAKQELEAALGISKNFKGAIHAEEILHKL